MSIEIEQAFRAHVGKHGVHGRAMFTLDGVRALLDELSRLREAERALDDLQSWVRQSRIDLPLDPDFHPKYETLKAIGAKIRAARALSTQVEERE